MWGGFVGGYSVWEGSVEGYSVWEGCVGIFCGGILLHKVTQIQKINLIYFKFILKAYIIIYYITKLTYV